MRSGDSAARCRGMRPAPSAEAGYNLVVLVVLIAVMNVAVAAALPYWSNWAKREKEHELIFRGLQYAEAIRLFRVRHGRLPTTLDELIEVEPRAIRQLWPNPMAEDGRWGLLMQGTSTNAGGEGSATSATTNPAATGGTGVTATPPPDEDEGPIVGPILGVYSATPGPSLRIWNGQEGHETWHFTVDLIQLASPPTDGRPPPRMNSEWIGRPFPRGLLDGAARDGSAPRANDG